MPIKITKGFQWSPNGYDVATVDAGEYDTLPDRVSEIAAQLGVVDEVVAPPFNAPTVDVPQVHSDGVGAVAGSGQPSSEGPEASAQTTEATQFAAAPAAGEAASEAKQGRRRGRGAEAANG